MGTKQRNTIQNMVFGFGLVFLFLGIIGLVVPGLFKMHLSFLHNMLYVLSAFLAFFASLSQDVTRVKSYCSYMGVFYLVLAIIGYVVGQPGYPSVGNLSEDQRLVKIIPNILEFGQRDHSFHLIIGVALVVMRLSWRKAERAQENF